MNILILNPNITTGGAQRIVLNLAYCLRKLGNNVLVFTTLIDRKTLPDKFKGLKFIESKNQILKKGGVTTQYQNIDNLLLLFIRLLKIRYELIKIIQKQKIDVVITHQQPFNWVLAFFNRCLVVWNCFEPVSLWKPKDKNYFPLRIEENNFIQDILEEIYEWLDKKIICYGIRHIFVLSQLTQRQIYNLYGKKVVVFHSGIDPDWLNQTINLGALKKYNLSPNFNILQVGQFTYEKNQLLTIDVFKKIKQKIPEAKLILIGDGPLREKIEEKIRNLKLQESVILTSRLLPLNSPLLAAFYQKADVLVFPSLIQSWGLVPFEALAFGTIPLVSEKCGSARVIEKEKIGLVMKLNPNDYYRKLIYIYKHKEKVREMAVKGKKYTLTHLTYEVYARKIQEKIWKLQ